MDLYANEWQTFRRITLPLVAPGIAAAALLAFSLSFDDYIITNFTIGTEITFPKFVFTSAIRGVPAQANVIGASMFFIALAIVIVGQVLASKRKSKVQLVPFTHGKPRKYVWPGFHISWHCPL
ncbi:hypothetical protein FGO68_gene13456 [Halteria grandinella]|uniref:ABC transmembrane type-1 domain-containing protein n=1 Tax=Halteria grandinella TaxID=5974 RepID=A0A8J8SU85_HALGN|nr:hypothetical protein FGO68_gene13456 [Halteria grandinella]